MHGRRLDEGGDDLTRAQAELLDGGTRHQRKQRETRIELDPGERAARLQGNDAGGQPVAHAAGHPPRTLEDHVFTADAGEHVARDSRQGNGHELRCANLHVGQPIVIAEHTARMQCLHADDARHLGVGRAVEDLEHGPGLAHSSVPHDHQLVPEHHGLGAIVGHQQRGRSTHQQQLPQFTPQLFTMGGIQRGQRFVQQQQARAARQRARQRHALLLAARELRRPALLEARKVKLRKQRRYAPATLGGSEVAQAVAQVARHREMGKQSVVLEDETDAALLRRALDAARGVEPGLFIEPDEALVGPVEPGEAAQHRGLAAARRPEQHGDGRPAGNTGQVGMDCRTSGEASREARVQRAGHA